MKVIMQLKDLLLFEALKLFIVYWFSSKSHNKTLQFCRLRALYTLYDLFNLLSNIKNI